jgi:hypothetical protein
MDHVLTLRLYRSWLATGIADVMISTTLQVLGNCNCCNTDHVSRMQYSLLEKAFFVVQMVVSIGIWRRWEQVA